MFTRSRSSVLSHIFSTDRTVVHQGSPLRWVVVWWVLLAAITVVGGPTLVEKWLGWPWALGAAALWGANVLLVVYGFGPPLHLSRPPVLAAAFAFLMTLLGSGSYWATTQLYPIYRVPIERAAWFVSVCTFAALVVAVATSRLFGAQVNAIRRPLSWNWSRLEAMTYMIFVLAVIGTFVTIRRIGYVPVLTGDPTSARIEYPAIGGLWYRLSMLGGVAALLVATLAAARRASRLHYAVGAASLLLVGLYGPRFFVALPLGVAILLWDRVRRPGRLARAGLLVAVAAPSLAFLGYLRERDQSVSLLGPVALSIYGTIGEFRDLAWSLDYYGFGDRFLYGRTFGSVVVPLLPSPVWRVVGIDKPAVYADDSATLLAQAMGQPTGQRIGAFGEFFMNYGWIGAMLGAMLYGVLLGYLDDRLRRIDATQVRSILLVLTLAAAVFAQIGQLNMFTSTLTGFGYPILLVALIAARRTPSTE